MAGRDERARISAETVAITQAGSYTAPSGRVVSIRDAVRAAVSGSVLITPEELRPLRARADRAIAARGYETTFEVRNETTLAAAHRLVARLGPERVAALNFASARNPGGGFLNGSQAQEESLARASALHACLERQPAFYEANRRGRSLLYTDHMIVAPRVVVFRDDHDRLLEEPWEVTLVTAPAPNAGAIAKNEPASSRQIEPAFRRRIEGVLSATVAFNQSALVLGAWGCGVFGNEPATVARLFGDFLLGDGPFARAFAHVTFAVLDRHGEIIAPFTEVFGGHGASQPAPK